MESLNKSPGIYTLILRLKEAKEIKVGSLGSIGFAAGYYSYTGSARGSGGCKRVNRHIQVLKGFKSTRKWHIDYLLPDTSFVEVFITSTILDLECQVAASIEKRLMPIKGFGSSDCRCAGHLHFSDNLKIMHEAVRLAHGRLD